MAGMASASWHWLPHQPRRRSYVHSEPSCVAITGGDELMFGRKTLSKHSCTRSTQEVKLKAADTEAKWRLSYLLKPKARLSRHSMKKGFFVNRAKRGMPRLNPQGE